MAKVTQGVETLPKISIAWVGCTNVTDDRQTDGRTITYSEREREFTFAKNGSIILAITPTMYVYHSAVNTTVTKRYVGEEYKINRKLVSRWDSERELPYDDIVHTLQNTIDSYINCTTDRSRNRYVLEHRFTKFSEITQCNGHYAVQVHSRSPILVPVESLYTVFQKK